MYVKKSPNIIYREYSGFGYLSDNRNYGYDTASHSSTKVGDLVLSKEGYVFCSVLSSSYRSIESLVQQLLRVFSGISEEQLMRDAISFYKELSNCGFVLVSNNPTEHIINDWFSYDNRNTYEFDNENVDYYSPDSTTAHRLLRVHIDISSGCNEQCIHCYIPTEKRTGVMTADLFNHILGQCIEIGVQNITISGGEPILNKHLADFLIKCGNNNFSVNLLSNLTLLTDDLISILRCNPLFSVQTSLYSMDEHIHDLITGVSGSFRKTVSAIGKLHKHNIPMQINTPIIKQNANSYDSVKEWANMMNITSSNDLMLFGCYDNSCSNLHCRIPMSDIKSILQRKFQNHQEVEAAIRDAEAKQISEHSPICSVCKNSLCISSHGEVYPCEGWQGLKIGNLNKQSLLDIWNNNPIVHQLRSLTFKDFKSCMKCSNRRYCPTCLIMNANEDDQGDIFAINPYMCEIARIKHGLLG